MKATEQFNLVVLFIMLYKMVLMFQFVDVILKYDHENEPIKQYFSVVTRIML